MKISDEILAIANQLANENKKPTVALVKAKLSRAAPLPMIISTLKAWQHDPTFISASNEQAKEQEIIEDSEIAIEITKALAPVKQELAEIKALLETLLKK